MTTVQYFQQHIALETSQSGCLLPPCFTFKLNLNIWAADVEDRQDFSQKQKIYRSLKYLKSVKVITNSLKGLIFFQLKSIAKVHKNIT